MANSQSDWDLPHSGDDQFKNSPTYRAPQPPGQEVGGMWQRVGREAAIGAATGGALGLGVGAVTGPGALATGAFGALGGAITGAGTQLVHEAYKPITGQEPPPWLDPAVATGLGLAEGGIPLAAGAIRSGISSLVSHAPQTAPGLAIAALAAEHFGGNIMQAISHIAEHIGLAANPIAQSILASAGLSATGALRLGRSISSGLSSDPRSLLYPATGLITGASNLLAPVQEPSASAPIPPLRRSTLTPLSP